MGAHVFESDLPAERGANRAGNAFSEPGDARPKKKQRQQDRRDDGQPTPGAKEFHRTALNVRDQRVSSKK